MWPLDLNELDTPGLRGRVQEIHVFSFSLCMFEPPRAAFNSNFKLTLLDCHHDTYIKVTRELFMT